MGPEVPDIGLLRLISEAAFDPAKWVDVCDGMAEFSQSVGGCMIPTEVAQRAMGLPHSSELEEFVVSYQQGGWYKRDLRERGLPTMFRKGIMSDADCVDYDVTVHDPYYQEFLGRVGLRWFLGLSLETTRSKWVMTLQRGLSLEPFSSKEIEAVMAYHGALVASTIIAEQVGYAKVLGASEALEAQGLCAIALGRTGQVTHVSPSAEKHLNNGLIISGARLYPQYSSNGPALAQLIQGICRSDPVASHQHVALARGGGKPPLVVYGLSLPDAQRDIFRPAVGLLVISDPQRPQKTPSPLLREYFGLTPAEAVLAAALMQGDSVESHAIARRVSVTTVRNQLQSLMSKTGTHRQGELVAKLLRVIPPH